MESLLGTGTRSIALGTGSTDSSIGNGEINLIGEIVPIIP
jgi:hypothetical protein